MVRSITCHFQGKEVSGSATYAASDLDGRTRKHDQKKAFTLMFLGVDQLADPQLEPIQVLNRIGLWSEKQLVEALGEEKVAELVAKMIDGDKG